MVFFEFVNFLWKIEIIPKRGLDLFCEKFKNYFRIFLNLGLLESFESFPRRKEFAAR